MQKKLLLLTFLGSLISVFFLIRNTTAGIDTTDFQYLASADYEPADELFSYALKTDNSDPLIPTDFSESSNSIVDKTSFENLIAPLCETVTISITFDLYPAETRWELVDVNGTVLLSGEGYSDAFDLTTINETICLEEGCYDFKIYDSYGDGMCCGQYGDGSYSVTKADGTIIAEGGTFGFSEFSNFCINEIAPCNDSDGDGICDDQDICPGGDDTIDSDGDGVPDGCDSDICETEEISVSISFDNYAPETSWILKNSNGVVVFSGGGYTDEDDLTTLVEKICLEDGCYDFIIYDSYNDGICCQYGEGSYEVTKSDGTIIASGGSFTTSDTTNFCLESSPQCADSDSDGVCDEQDVCDGGNDNIDSDLDGIPDFCDTDQTVFIDKFLNGNMPVTTPDDINGPFAPALLSETGAFEDLVNMIPSPGLIPYEMIEPFWSDGAAKFRWMAVPSDGNHDTAEEQIVFSNDVAWDFPRGSVLIKHFELGGKKLETRFEIKGDDDVYYYLTYKWNDNQTDAELLNESLFEEVDVNGSIVNWQYPSRVQCMSCHFPQNGSVLGPKTRNLNKIIEYADGVAANQLVKLSNLGIIPENINDTNVGDYMAVAAKDDPNASLEDRARSYIDVNCSSCHNPNVDNIAQFDARYTTPLELQNIIDGEVNYDLGLNDPKVVNPADVANSVLHYRTNSLQQNVKMPPLGKDVVDVAGVQLMEEWINSLSPNTDSPPEAILSASPTNGPAPLVVSFDASASTDPEGNSLTYLWDFGDGTSSEEVTTTHEYTVSGDYTVILTVDDGQQTNQTSTVISVGSTTGSGAVSFSESTSMLQGDNNSGLVMGVVDMNGDGKDDIVQFDQGTNLKIQYQTSPGQVFNSYTFGEVANTNDGDPPRKQWSVVMADIDKNGLNDILSGGYYDGIKIISNNGSNNYTSEFQSNGRIFIQGSNFVDIDSDGWIDAFACHDDAESRAYTNNSDGTFSWDPEILDTETVPSSDNSGNYASTWIDYDNDGDLDLYISKCRGGVTDPTDPRRINMLMQNDGNNNFVEAAAEANLKNGEQTWLTDFGDIDNDGDLDAIIINHGSGPNLMQNNGDGTFTEITASSGLLPTLNPENIYGVQGFFKDFNNDGFLDLMVSGDAHYLFFNTGNGTFELAANPFNSNTIQSFSVGDLNHDGFLDIYAGYATGLNTPTAIKDVLWLNQGNGNNFFNLQLTGIESNINGIGARVELYGSWGIQIRDVKSGEGYGVMNSMTQHFGLGASSTIDRLVIKWPSGIVDEIYNPSPNQFLSVIEGTNCSDTDNDGVCDAIDVCQGADDGLDSDTDGVPDSCDICEGGDDSIDSDGDGVPDFCDTENCESVIVSISFDDYARETSWELLDGNGLVVLSGDGYTDADDFTTITESACLEDGCYDFIIYDSYNDGICCGQYGDGSYIVTKADGTILASGGEFTTSETTNFCIAQLPNCNDSDGDGVCDEEDICEGGDDTVDSDGDGIPDFCDTENCESVIVSISFDDYARETSWELLDGNGLVVLSGDGYTNADDFTTITESICLEDGCYDFIIYDSYNDGICCGQYGDGSYTVTKADGTILASGGEFTTSETTNFCIAQLPNCDDSDGDGVCDEEDICEGGDDTIDSDGDGIPDFCDPETCESVTVTINFDDYARETSWELLDGNGLVLLSGNGYTDADDFTTIVENICLDDGCYDFVIYDSYGDGICCGQYGDGSYSVTGADGTVLASGGTFTDSETANFCLPTGSTALQSEFNSINDLTVFPNPASEEAYIGFDSPTEVYLIQVFDITGRLVQQIDGGLIDSRGIPIYIRELPIGVYFVRTTNTKGVRFQGKLLIER